jgi:hypothetical protein
LFGKKKKKKKKKKKNRPKKKKKKRPRKTVSFFFFVFFFFFLEFFSSISDAMTTPTVSERDRAKQRVREVRRREKVRGAILLILIS